MADTPNILLVVLDTARADAFEPYGAAPGSGPAIAQLADSGAALSARSNACWTLPSHASLFTGMLPRRSGLVRMPGEDLASCQGPLRVREDRLLPVVLGRAGYETRAVSANLWVSPATGFDHGFDEFVAVDSGRQGGIHSDRFDARARWLLEGARARVDDGADEAERAIHGWIAGRPAESPFFWFVNLIEAHSPYLPPRPYNPLGMGDRLRAASEARRYLNLGAIWKACAGGFEVPQAALERMRELYSASVRLMDDWISRLLEALDAAGELERTIVVITSDHGENLGENGLMGHSFSLDDRLTRVPLIWSGPGEAPATTPVSLADVPALLAASIGLEGSPWPRFDPESPTIAEFDPPTGRDDPRVAQALGEWGLGSEAIPLITSHLTSATEGAVKLVRSEHVDEDGQRIREELIFELDRDPLEGAPLRESRAAGHPMYQRLAEALESSQTGAAGASEADADQLTAAPEISDEERRSLEERMKLLGYM